MLCSAMIMMSWPKLLDLSSSSDDPGHDGYVTRNIPFPGFSMYPISLT
jgi:hypothetical protein